MVNQTKKFFKGEEAASAIEYALLVGLIAVAIVTAVTALGNSVSKAFNNAAKSIGT